MDAEEIKNHKLMDEMKAFVLMAKPSTVAAALTALLGLFTATMLEQPAGKEREAMLLALTSILTPFPTEVTEILVSIFLGRDMTNDKDK